MKFICFCEQWETFVLSHVNLNSDAFEQYNRTREKNRHKRMRSKLCICIVLMRMWFGKYLKINRSEQHLNGKIVVKFFCLNNKKCCRQIFKQQQNRTNQRPKNYYSTTIK